jgi:hypothetical protein
MVLYLCVLIVFSLRRESLKLILATDPLPRWFCHSSEDTEPERSRADDDMDVNVIFKLPAEFRAADDCVVELALGAQVAVFQKPENLGVHLKPLFVKGYLQGQLV